MKYLELIRVKQWIKNFLVVLPLVCYGILTKNLIMKVILGFVAFSLMSSTIYIINDIKDCEKDKLHPRKKKRPLPSGRVSKKEALVICSFLLIFSLFFNFLANQKLLNSSLIYLFVYFLINLLYSFKFKNYPIIDVSILAFGFILRVFYGASLINITVSNWLFLTVLCASLFMALGKRRKEAENNINSRNVLKSYSVEFLKQFQYSMVTLTLVFYSLWSIEQNNTYLVYSVPLLLMIFMRYCLLIEKSDEGDPTTLFYQDKFLIISCLIYIVLMFILLVVI